ncbi:RNA polymerase factor sigma-54 [Sulfurivirga sp.]|uniref:RNA polymerase factor sigma-54 n=1 Tax=Sulfurivirga sp. TaxID=2614236 RepID=UPI0025D82503|nr:RNA polymerase factor sigma-54 [Sulfurivirga sp.]
MALFPGMQVNLTQSQQLKLTPQLQQSIKVLQQSVLEVQQLVEQTLEENIFLELEQDEDGLLEALAPETSNEEDAPQQPDTDEIAETVSETLPEDPAALSDELESDTSWEDIYQDDGGPITAHGRVSDEDFTAAENYTAELETLHDHLLWQVETLHWDNPLDQLIAEYIVDSIDDDGYLQDSLAQIRDAVSEHAGEPVTEADVQRVLDTVQQFDPTGVGARDLQECLLLQLRAAKPLPEDSALHEQAEDLISNHFDLLANHQYKRIQRRYRLKEPQLHELIHYIQRFDPRPGRQYAPVERDYVIPDLILRRVGEELMLELNPEAYPRLRLNAEYIQLAQQVEDPKQSEQLREKLAEARNLIKSLHHRGETLLRVGRFIVERQKRFFEEGEKAMQPLVLRDVAEALDLHESTISRATSQKYIQTPRGTFELKYFFSTAIVQYGEEDQSAVAIKSHIRELIEQEDPKKPLSDSRIAALLEEQGIHVARRTIAKYREAMGIPASSERKRLNYFKTTTRSSR